MKNIDWQTIRTEYEQGTSQRSLARKYSIAQPTISERVKRENWYHPSIPIIPRSEPIIGPISDRIEDESTIILVEKALRSLAKHLELTDGNNLDLRSHKLFADSLSQYVRVKMLLPEETKTASGIAAELLPYFSTEQLNEWTELEKAQTAIIEMVQAQKLEQEQNIKTIRRAG